MFGHSDAYELFMGRWSRQLAPAFVTFAEVADGDHVLDVGSGTGSLSFAIAQAAPSVRVTGVDPSAEYVRHAQSQPAGDRIRFVVGDAQRLDFPDRTFDRTLSLLVMSFVPDRNKAVREMMRVTRQGGTVAAAVWDYGQGMEMLRVFWDEVVAQDPAAAALDERHLPLCRQGELASLWRASGFDRIDERPLSIAMRFTSFDDYWQPFLGGQGPAGAYVRGLHDEQRQALEQQIRSRIAPTGHGQPISLNARAWVVKGIVPRT
jgi:SAM-dependent methyltransferase